jgi:7,8-dihydropterin-6-yl-methyl-4-(beta-D-ribofuranosyl)aminobenzene 5'-phosphate synthase
VYFTPPESSFSARSTGKSTVTPQSQGGEGEGRRREVKVKIVYDNEAKEGFLRDWGFSCLIEQGEWKILFDTGASGEILTHNLHQFGIQVEEIAIIALSHKHWDHIGGLRAVLHPGAAVCLPSSFPLGLKKAIAKKAARIVEVWDQKEIVPGVYTTGEVGRPVKEQSLVVRTSGNEGVIAIIGGAHPGLEQIMEAAKRIGALYGVIGGFHGFKKLELLGELSLIMPCHFTKRRKELLRLYPNTTVRCGAGAVIDL